MKRASFSTDPARYWNTWGRFVDGDAITHAQEERSLNASKGRAICGVRVTEGGGLNLADTGAERWQPGCFRCQAILKKRGLL